ncbi:MAG: efflux RND transporter permease subunit [Alistipes sp.]|nr:efflux RND transporter permease subunit [Candidatus Alistipes equi]
MKLKTFIERPVLSGVISILICLLGVMGLLSLPIEKYPDIAPPTIQVEATYYGANAETIQKSVIVPLETAINGVDGMMYISSQASNAGTASISVVFKQGTDPDMAAVNVQNRISMANGELPSEVLSAGVKVSKRQNSMLQIININSPTDKFDEEFLGNYASINIKPKVLRISGVGQFMMLGSDYSMRIWLKPDVMSQYSITPADVSRALAEQNIEAATGVIGENSTETYQYTMKFRGRLKTAEEFGDIIVRATQEGEVLRLREIADVQLGIETYSYKGAQDGHPGVLCLVYQTADSNATEVNKQIDQLLDEVRKTSPDGVEITQMMSTNVFLFASMHEVIKTLIEAIILVIIVVFVFLQDFRSTIIPFVGIAVSLIGTFAFMSVVGFSLNLITLFALVLVIGTVVDDAIVVVEAVHAKFDQGYKSAMDASVDAMSEISMAVVTSSLVFMAVFIPVSFMKGTSGVFFQQFGLTMAVAVGISAINALTLSPALCALLLKPKDLSGNSFRVRFAQAFDRSFNNLSLKYKKYISFFASHKLIVWTFIVGCLVVFFILIRSTKTSLVPEEDQGMLIVEAITPPGTSLGATSEVLEKAYELASQIEGIEHISSCAGYGFASGASASAGCLIIKLKPFEEREDEATSVAGIAMQLDMAFSQIQSATFIIGAMPMIPGYGNSNAIEVYLQDNSDGDMAEFAAARDKYVAALSQRPEIQYAFSSFSLDFPQWEVCVDVAKCKRAGLLQTDVLSALSSFYGGQYVSNINLFSHTYKVMLQAAPRYRMNEESLNTKFITLPNGSMAPLTQFVTLKKSYGPEVVSRFNLLQGININVQPNPGYSTGDAIRAIKETVKAELPEQYTTDLAGMAREESEQGSIVVIFAICILMIYLILSALYESFLLPFAILLSIPAALFGAFAVTIALGMENNIYLQTGIIMLIGLISKTGILITEFAVQKRKEGMSIVDAAIAAAGVRLRPIMMTVLTMVFGLLPLLVATGVGANGNRSLGTGTVAGLVIGTLGLMIIVPVLFIVFETLQEKLQHKEEKQ